MHADETTSGQAITDCFEIDDLFAFLAARMEARAAEHGVKIRSFAELLAEQD
ncbi:hypothetical protein SY2F82_12120 [Streptomyces sp. Y2F8-2]|uniref:hypothetical protein n=1 Tax=Streptomyces sp. Y2F8-2 TaxID=2759675 RepID=UPI001908FB20|nr:hypothetical protein [Streptomyces sp. Y2F8-2]GHJ99414.1 hypothetical protein SY2F82_12120 [Streptomyces sp. Y2F8-2]